MKHYFSEDVSMNIRGHKLQNKNIIERLSSNSDNNVLKEELLLNNRPLIYFVISNMDTEEHQLTDYEKECLYSEGLVALWQAILKFDYSTNCLEKFASYIFTCIRFKMYNSLDKSRKNDVYEISDLDIISSESKYINYKDIYRLLSEYYYYLFPKKYKYRVLLHEYFKAVFRGDDLTEVITKAQDKIGTTRENLSMRLKKDLDCLREAKLKNSIFDKHVRNYASLHNCSYYYAAKEVAKLPVMGRAKELRSALYALLSHERI